MTRFLSLSLFAVVTGVALGMGLAYENGSSLDAWTSMIPNFHAAPPAQYATRRAVNRRIVPPVRTNTVQTQQSSSAVPVVDTTDPTCSAVLKTIKKIQAVYTAVVPMNAANTAMRQKLDAVFADAMDDYCTQSAASSSAASVESAATSVTVDNHCENYPKITARYTQCVISNGLGRKFP